MIQRMQSLWLLLAAVAIFFVFKLPFAGGKKPDGLLELYASGNLFLFIVAILLMFIAVTAIVLFKNRPNQKRLIWLGILLDIIFLVMIYYQMETLKDPTVNRGISEQTFKIGAVLPVLYVIFLVMAYNGIRHDEKLIKSADRLR